MYVAPPTLSWRFLCGVSDYPSFSRKTAEVVHEIHAEAIHIGEELDEHNKIIDEAIKASDAANKHLEENTRKLRAEL